MELIKKSAFYTLDQLQVFIQQFDEASFVEPLELLSGNTIGKHVRHIIEIFQCLLTQSVDGKVNYDVRSHSQLMESSVSLSIQAVSEIQEYLKYVKTDKHLTLLSASGIEGQPFSSITSMVRELQYNVEHAIHHMAIIKIAVKQKFPNMVFPENFGMGYSTVQYLKSQSS
jgi:hypothetical protein